MKYHVHVYTIVRIKVANVEADNQEEAIRAAEDFINYREVIDKEFPKSPDRLTQVEHIEWTEEETSEYLVDEVGDDSFSNSKFWKPTPDGNLIQATRQSDANN